MAGYKHFKENIPKQNVRHVLGISGGKDNAALAIKYDVLFYIMKSII